MLLSKESSYDKVQINVIKKSLLLSICFLIGTMFLGDRSFSLPIGLVIGTAVGIIRFKFMGWQISRILSSGYNKNTVAIKSMILYILNHVILIAILVIAISIKLKLFFGVATGVLLVPHTLFLCGLGETYNLIKVLKSN